MIGVEVIIQRLAGVFRNREHPGVFARTVVVQREARCFLREAVSRKRRQTACERRTSTPIRPARFCSVLKGRFRGGRFRRCASR